ncbi:unnamed protein product, partial [Mesorhabditis spiculigera]
MPAQTNGTDANAPICWVTNPQVGQPAQFMLGPNVYSVIVVTTQHMQIICGGLALLIFLLLVKLMTK